MAKRKSCPTPGAIVTFRPRPGILRFYEKNARQLKLVPLRNGDVGIVRGVLVQEHPADRKRVVVAVGRTKREHVIDCNDLKVRRRR